MKESEKIDKYLDFDRELKNVDHEVNGDTNGSLEMVLKCLVWRLEKLTIKNNRGDPDHSIRSRLQLEYLKESWRNEKNCCHSDSGEKPPVKTDMKNSQGLK